MTQEHLTYDTSTMPRLCVIWMHGLGADANDMLGLAQSLDCAELPIRHIFLNAPHRPITLNQGMVMQGWYDIIALQAKSREDSEGVWASKAMIDEVIQHELKQGFLPEQIILCGFSQGGAMALFSGLQLPVVGGIVSLSAYLPIAGECQVKAPPQTPIFMAYGRFDEIVSPAFTLQSIAYLENQGFKSITHHEYPMGHTVCPTELLHLAKWFKARMNVTPM